MEGMVIGFLLGFLSGIGLALLIGWVFKNYG